MGNISDTNTSQNAADKPSSGSLLLTTVRFLTNLRKTVIIHHTFHLVNGNKITSLKQLALELDTMPDDVFNYHVNDTKNDFCNWIRDVIKDEELAKSISNISNKKEMQLCILKYIVKKI